MLNVGNLGYYVVINCFVMLQKREKGRMRVHYINNVNRVLDVLAKQYSVSV